MLELRKISLTVQDEDGSRWDLLKNVSLTIPKDSFVAITGPNGSGKSTLARIIMGLVQPTSGQLLLDGRDITNAGIAERAKAGIGFAFQQPVRFKGMRVSDLLRLAAGRDLSTMAACGYLSEVGLCAVDYVDREIDDSLSGGEIKRIEIAMLIARKPRLSIFDEPEAGIDLWSFHHLIQVFQQLRQETRGGILVISHQERILEIADRIIVVEDGQVKQDGPREDVLPGLILSTDVCEFYRREDKPQWAR